jgi:hypothetical protein
MGIDGGLGKRRLDLGSPLPVWVSHASARHVRLKDRAP